jgi:hypothetical protein
MSSSKRSKIKLLFQTPEQRDSIAFLPGMKKARRGKARRVDCAQYSGMESSLGSILKNKKHHLLSRSLGFSIESATYINESEVTEA